MHRRMRSISSSIVAGFLCVLPHPAGAQAPPPLVRVVATEPGRQELVVTNQDLAVVVETRRATLPAGEVEAIWEDAAPSARTETWSLVNAREAGVRALGLTAPLTGQAGEGHGWLGSLIGRTVRIVRPGGSSSEGEVVAVHGPTPDLVLFREGNDLVYGEPDARLSVPAPGSAGPRPRTGVTLKLSSERAGARDLTSRYLVSGMTWHADYALTLASDEKSGRLEGWFTVDNRSGADYRPTRLRLLAGVLRTAPQAAPMSRRSEMAVMETVDVQQSAELSESRIYDVPNARALPAGRTLIALADNAAVGLEKRYLARSNFWVGQNDEPHPLPVVVGYRVAAKALARALPAGTVRVYADSGSVFTGEDRIAHTPERTDFDIETSEAFDLTARRRQVTFQQIGRLETESSWEVILSSRKSAPAVVTVRESFPGDWTIVESSAPPRRRSASVVEFDVTVPPGGEAKLTYRVRVKIRG